MNAASHGSKADNLDHLRRSGFNIPDFYILDASVKQDLHDAKIANKLTADFKSWLAKTGASSVAVRSSSTQEDAKESSFAGQFKTVLDVKSGDDFIDALSTVSNSKQSRAYSKKSGQVHVIVQEFIEPDVSGVIFSVNPANGNNEFVINAAAGRGTNVVEGRSAEQYFVERLDPANFSHHGSGANSGLLSESNIKELAAVTQSIESLFAVPQDIEWAIKDSKLYVLQARPITHISHLRVWDSSNLAESFPGIVLPLTFSVAKRGYLLGYKAQAYSAGLSWYELEAQHRTFDAMIGIFNGKMYYNLLNWYKFIALFPGSSRNQKFLDDQIATQGQAVYQLPTRQSFIFKTKFAVRILYRALSFNKELKRFYARYKQLEQDLSRMPQHGDSQLLMTQYTHIEQTIIPHFGRTVDNDFFVMTYHGWLKKLLNKWLTDQPFERNNMIGSVSGVLSAEQALSLYKLAEKFRSDKEALRLLQAANYNALDNYVSGSELQEAINKYIEVFGHRFAEDQKIEAVNLTLEPHGIYKLMAAYVKLDNNHIKDLPDRIKKRRLAYKEFAKIDMPERFITKSLPSLEQFAGTTVAAKLPVKQELYGIISSPGTIEGRAVVLSEPKIPNEPYDILVAKHTDPGWTPLIALAKGVVVEHGGMLSHAAIVTRELGIPSIIGVPNATSVIKTGMLVRINAQTSKLEIIET